MTYKALKQLRFEYNLANAVTNSHSALHWVQKKIYLLLCVAQTHMQVSTLWVLWRQTYPLQGLQFQCFLQFIGCKYAQCWLVFTHPGHLWPTMLAQPCHSDTIYKQRNNSNTRINLYSSMISAMGSCNALPILVHATYSLMSHPKDKVIMVKYLAQGNKCHDQDSNPKSADQKHQSLSQVLSLAQPRYAKKVQSVCSH